MWRGAAEVRAPQCPLRCARGGLDLRAMSYLLYFLLLVGPLVLIHEFGHFAVAKLLGIKVVRFSFGFGPRLIGFKKGDTDYRLSLLPLGGYVKMAGDNPSEALAPEDEGRGFIQAPPWKRALIAVAGPAMNLIAPLVVFFAIAAARQHQGVAAIAWQVRSGSPAAQSGVLPGDRVVKVEGRPIRELEDLQDAIGDKAGQPVHVTVDRYGQSVTLVVTPPPIAERDELETTHRAIIGISAAPPPATIGILDPRAPAALAGLRTFDLILKIGDKVVKNQVDVQSELARAQTTGQPTALTVLRGKALGYAGLGPGVPTVLRFTLPPSPVLTHPYGVDAADLFVRWVIPGSPAAAGLHAGDRLLALDGKSLESWWDYEDQLKALQGTPFTLQVVSPGAAPREVKGAQLLLDLGESLVTGQDVKALGFGLLHDGEPLSPNDLAGPRSWVFPNFDTISYRLSVAECAQRAWGATYEVTRKEIIGILRVFQGRVSVKKLGGPLMIADVAHQAAQNGLAAFLFMMTLVSINLGLVNLLPAPALDGGHIATSLIEMARRKPLSRRAYELTNAVGFALLVGLMLFVLVNDVVQGRVPWLAH